MSRREALLVLLVGAALVVSGLVWLFGPYGLLAGGVGLLGWVLFGVQVREGDGDVVADAAQPRYRVSP